MTEALTAIRQDTFESRQADHELVAAGVLDHASYAAGYRPGKHIVEVHTTSLLPHGATAPEGSLPVTQELIAKLGIPAHRLFSGDGDEAAVIDADGFYRDPLHDNQRRFLREVRRQENLRTTMGRDQIQRILMFGDTGTGLQTLAGALTSVTGSTQATPAGGGLPASTSAAGNSGLQGKLMFVGPNNSGVGSTVFGVIVSNTATVITVDQWYAIPITVAAGVPGIGTTPNGTGNYFITTQAAASRWIGLSTDTVAPNAGDILRTADGLFSISPADSSSAATEQNANGLARAFCIPTFGSGTAVLANTWTYTGSSLVTLAKVVNCNSKAAVGSLLFADTALSANASVNANGDSVGVTWTFTL